MLTYQKNTVRTSVRKLVEFFLRNGDITTGSSLVLDPEAMQEGSRLHRKIQKAQKASYRSEVSLKMSWQQESFELVLEGRADGIDMIDYEDRKIALIDEIKGVYHDVDQMEEAEPLHLAQAKCYAYMYGSPKGLQDILVRITYCNIETEQLKYITQRYTMEELESWFLDLIDQYKTWAENYVQARKQRNNSIAHLHFPFSYRPGQKKLTAMVYHSLSAEKSIFLQAPTGVGKTISAIYPALKILGEEKTEKVFYLTAKTVTRTVAEQTIKLLREQGLRLRAVSITAKEKICTNEVMDCNPSACEKANGHFDRINEALYALLTEHENMKREDILEYAQRYRVCPYELSFEAAAWADFMICDYNYVFDPHVNRKSLFGDKTGNVLLVDEAHNLPDRAREMYSASIRKDDFLKMKKIFRDKNKGIVKRLQSCNSVLLRLGKNLDEIEEKVDDLYYPLFWLLGSLEDYMKDHPDEEKREEIVEFYFQVSHFFMILDTMEAGYNIYGEGSGGHLTVHLFCVDPSSRLEQYLKRCRSVVFFSATLLPIPYYKQLLGGDSSIDAFSISSPFDRQRKLLAIADDVTSRYSQRGEMQYRRMVRYLEETVSVKKGNYIIFFPSYEMLSLVYSLARDSTLSLVAELIAQEPSMTEGERETFLEKFEEHKEKSLVGFCVLGSIFSEGIDLTGTRLIGALIVGTGLPQVCKEREMIRTYFDRQGKKGYDYAYRYPGMNKILQAAGRVIRTAEDVGIVLLLDDRFLLRENQVLLPEEWDSFYEVNLRNYGKVLEQFWVKH
ncbi:MAG: ATP-dependent DNA helicase [Clostridiales bacterium]|nr:ATP-dependent DNA helicase [Clostridiales bacterium]